MESSATSPTGNSSFTGSTIRSIGEDVESLIDILECTLDVGIDDVEVSEMPTDEDREIEAPEAPNVGAHVTGSYVSPTLAQVFAMEFDCPEAAFRFYEQYSRGKGFSMRHGRSVKNKNGEIVRYTLCNRQGFREKKWLKMPKRKREHKVVTRCGCPAELRIKPKEGTSGWYVS
ncbi:hypothetical protein PIB30_119175 [Stylosanthes scabra]|uniref:FAR1 domain-containing protein n=1 Tax=Stylosanthes scabra TaxID=79078 RepID=A0ABU6WN70_9FABA|nr:hypothetical protein [Stylosanthes scabra]